MNALSTLVRKADMPPLSQPSVDGIFAAAVAARAFPVPVHGRRGICEVAIWQAGEWVGSVFRHPEGGLGASSSVGDRVRAAYSAEDAVRTALGHEKLRVS